MTHQKDFVQVDGTIFHEFELVRPAQSFDIPLERPDRPLGAVESEQRAATVVQDHQPSSCDPP